MARTTIAAAATQLLTEHRALASAELGRLIAAQGLIRAKHPDQAVSRALSGKLDFRRLSGGRWARPATLLEGITLTHRLTELERTSGVLAMTPDLGPFLALGPDGIHLPDGGHYHLLVDTEALDATNGRSDFALHGPTGWLADVPSGQLLHVRFAGTALRFAAGPEPTAAARLAVRRLVNSADQRLALDAAKKPTLLDLPPVVWIEGMVLELLVDDPGLFAQPLPPIQEAIAAGGLEAHRGWLGRPGTDWAIVDELMTDLDDEGIDAAAEEDRELIEALGLAPAEVEGVQIVLGAYELSRRLGQIDDEEALAKLAQLLAVPAIATTLALKAWSDPDLEPFVASVADAAREADAAGARFVLAACAEARDDVETAERLFRLAIQVDPGFGPAVIEVARYDMDRGDYANALWRLRAARVPTDDGERVWLEGLVQPSVPKVGRNEPCPCGSGRKYKSCHLDQPGEMSAASPANALLHKLDIWLSQPNNQRLAEQLLDEAGAPASGVDDDIPVDPLLTDIALFDHGGLRRFLEVRGPLLPRPERDLGATWLASRRSLYQVDEVARGIGLTVHDLRVGGTSIELGDRSLSRQVQRLDVLCMRLLPDGAGGVTATDGVLVPRFQREHVMNLIESGDGIALLRWVLKPQTLPRLSNTEGEPLLLVTVEYALPDARAAAASLGRTLRDEGGGRFVETTVSRGQEWIRGSIVLEGDRATIDANSAKRVSRLERILKKAAPGARFIRREEQAIDDALERRRSAGPAADPIDLATNPEAAKAMDEFIRRYEANWVDEEIPALGGLTPRAAAADPAARGRLEAMLDDMTWQRNRSGTTLGTMDPNRIRALLALSREH